MVTPPVLSQSTHLANWRPILSPESTTAALAWESINAIADAILKKEYVRGEKEGVRGYLDHTYEEALLYAYLGAVHNDAEWANRATECLNLAIERQAHRFGYLGLYGGVAGLGWTVEHVSRLLQQVTFEEPDDASLKSNGTSEDDNSEDSDLNQEVDALIFRQIPEMTSSSPYDLISGLAGLGVYFLERLPGESAARGIEAVFEQLEKLARREDDGITWFSGPELLPDWQREQCPNGYYNMGVAHGIPGIIHFLSEVSANDFIDVDRVKTLLHGAMDWLIAHARPKGSASRFTSWFVPGRDQTDSRMAWCYGDLGILAVLLQVSRRAERRDWQHFAQELLDHCLSWPVEKAGIGDAPLCHGASGVAHIFNRIYQQEGDDRCRDAALLWYERTLAMRQPNSGVGGYSSLTRPDQGGPIVWDPSPAFLDGASGLALALLAAVTAVDPGWDRLLLLSGRR